MSKEMKGDELGLRCPECEHWMWAYEVRGGECQCGYTPSGEEAEAWEEYAEMSWLEDFDEEDEDA
jgi:hypothetical protein